MNPRLGEYIIVKKINEMNFVIGLFVLSSFLLQPQRTCAKDQIWAEKSAQASQLVQLPSIQPIIEELDATVVNISSSITKDRKEDGPPQVPQGPMDPFSSPEDFFEKFFGPGQQAPQRPRRSMGSGFIISDDGFIVTNNHVVDGADKIEVSLTFGNATDPNQDGPQEVYDATLVGRDARTDIALLKIKAKTKLAYAFLGNSDLMKKGDWVLAMGNPFGLDHSVSIGIVSAKGREISPNENRRFDDFIQTDAAINFGNSGGPLVNLKGEVIGINTAITAQGSGIGFAIPINLAKEIIPQLKEGGSVQRGYLGVMIQDVSDEMKSALGLGNRSGVLVNQIAEKGPAAKSALKPGDVILQVNGQATVDSKGLQRIIGKTEPSKSVNLEVFRDGKTFNLSVKLGTLDESKEEAPREAEQEMDRLGLAVSDSNEGGVEVQGIDPKSPAMGSGVIPGDRILQITYLSKKYDIKSKKEYSEILKKLKSGDSILLSLVRRAPGQNMSLFIAFRVP
ncbi:MAG: peptidase [Deltaproteobacteria bacterium CG11_big_fil_rev_8_21_14_0_20_45_16]|nr:MAG: peptidase [Deltaproteobacteria bacterium CG11_big_fil_rev_8_21_14_0_20_45_16]